MKSKIVLITGGARGLGFENAKQLSALGATVLITARDLQRAQEAAAALAVDSGDVHGLKLDVTSPDDISNIVAYIGETYGRLDVLINNAGIWLESPSASEMPGNVTSALSADILRKTFESNFFAVVAVTQALVPLIRKSDAGRIVNLSSILGSLTLHADPESPIYGAKAFAYNASKTALNAFTVHLAHELKDTTVKVNSIHPGWVRSAMGGASADMDIVEGSVTAVKLATIDEDGPTGGFFYLDQTLPW